MVKKLMKYEFLYYLRSMTPICIILLGMGIANRIIQIFENDSTSYNIVFYSSAILLGITSLVAIVMSVILAVGRFHKNLYSDEGYLSLVLPVTESEHIIAKVLSGVIVVILSCVAVLLALSAATAGDVFVEFWKAFGYIVKFGCRKVGTLNGIFYIIEGIVAVILAIAAQLLLFHTCDSLGQLAKKNRVLAAFGVFLIYYIICQVIGTIFVILANLDWWLIDEVVSFACSHPEEFVHCFFICLIIYELIFSAICFFITRWVLKKKLNLE